MYFDIFEISQPNLEEIPPGNEKAVWIEPFIVVTVKYICLMIETLSDSLYLNLSGMTNLLKNVLQKNKTTLIM